MDIQKVLENRRSIREYNSDRTIDRETIEELIKAASLAPTWKNSQTGRYHVVLSGDMKNKFREECLPEFNAKNSAGAAALIVTSFVGKRSGFNMDGTPTNELGDGWGIYDLALQNENLLLKATELGLGTLVMGIRDVDKIRELLNIPEEEIIVSVIAVGYSDKENAMPKRKTIDDICTIY